MANSASEAGTVSGSCGGVIWERFWGEASREQTKVGSHESMMSSCFDTELLHWDWIPKHYLRQDTCDWSSFKAWSLGVPHLQLSKAFPDEPNTQDCKPFLFESVWRTSDFPRPSQMLFWPQYLQWLLQSPGHVVSLDVLARVTQYKATHKPAEPLIQPYSLALY